jgi:hypothetical protein
MTDPYEAVLRGESVAVKDIQKWWHGMTPMAKRRIYNANKAKKKYRKAVKAKKVRKLLPFQNVNAIQKLIN